VWGPRCLTLSIHLHHCQGGPPPLKFVIPSGAKRTGGTCSFTFGAAKAPWANRLWIPFPHQRKLQIPPLRYPGFPVEVGGVGKPHAAFFTESRTPCPVLCGRKSGFAPVGMTKGRFVPSSTVCDVDGRIVRFALCVQLSPSLITAAKVKAALPFCHPERTPDFLPRCSQKQPRMRLSLKKAA
jgi:hypothetical protein